MLQFFNEHFTVTISILLWVTISLSLLIGTFIFYLAVMHLRDAQDRIWRLHWIVRWIGFAILFIGLLLDVALNWIFCTVTFLELPHEYLTTARIVRHKYHSTGWRYRQALWWCENWLTPFDEKHCEEY